MIEISGQSPSSGAPPIKERRDSVEEPLQTLPAARSAYRHHVAIRRLCYVKKGGPRKRIGMVADVPTVRPLDHYNTSVVIDRDDPDWDASQQLAHNVGMA